MEFDELSQSGIRRIANYSPYLDQLAGLANEMGLRQRSNLVHLERCLNEEWCLGQNSILSWAPLDDGLLVLVVPHYAIAEYTAAPDAHSENPQRVSVRFVTELISGDRQLTLSQMQKVARLLDVEPKFVHLRQPLSNNTVETQIIEKMIRRYGINFVASRAVTLFDIVGFSLLTPFEQMTQLNSLSYSLNSAHAKMLEQDVASISPDPRAATGSMSGIGTMASRPTLISITSCTSYWPTMRLPEARQRRRQCRDCGPVSMLAAVTNSIRRKAQPDNSRFHRR